MVLTQARKVWKTRVAAYVTRVFKVDNARSRGNLDPCKRERGLGKRSSRRIQRQREYLAAQNLWKKCPGKAAACILNGDSFLNQGTTTTPIHQMEDFWIPLMEAKSAVSNMPVVPPRSPETRLASVFSNPVAWKEVRKYAVRNSKAPGPDGIPARRWNKAPMCIRLLVLNLLLLAGRPAQLLSKARTVFLPKTGGSGPGDHRPISIASVVSRHFHKIIADRITQLDVVGATQRAFRPADGTAKNLSILQEVFHHSRRF